jgi:DNA-binding MarR family transcriptional regulator
MLTNETKGKFVPDKVTGYVIPRPFVRVDDLVNRFNFKRSTAVNYLNRLEKRGALLKSGRGLYMNKNYRKVEFFVSESAEDIREKILERLPYLDFTIWSTERLSPFSYYMPAKNFVFVETDKNSIDSIRDVLLEEDIKFLSDPSKEELNRAGEILDEPVIIFPRREKYGTKKIGNARAASLEKIIVDFYFLLTRRNFDFPLEEFGRILYNISENYSLNFTLLERYARRREIIGEIAFIYRRMKSKFPKLLIPGDFGEKYGEYEGKHLPEVKEILRGI